MTSRREQGAPSGASLRLCAYTRVSTSRQAAEGLGLEVQRRAIRSWAKATGHRVTLWTTDEGVSGANGVDSRVGLYEALEALRDGRVDGLITYNLDRLARRLEVQEAILGQVWAAGRRVLTVEDDGEVPEDDPNDPYRTAMRQVRGVFSQLERSMLAKRMRDGRNLKRETGGYAGDGSPPYGYRSESGTLVPVPEEQAVLDRIRELRAGGASLRQIGQTLTTEGHCPRPSKLRRHNGWAPETVRRIVARLDG